LTLADVAVTFLSFVAVADLAAATFLVALALVGIALRPDFAIIFLAGLDFALARLVTLIAFLAGAFAADKRFAIDFGFAAFGLRVLLFVAGLEVERLVAVRRILFVTGLLIGTT
jgi:hypothetical protein